MQHNCLWLHNNIGFPANRSEFIQLWGKRQELVLMGKTAVGLYPEDRRRVNRKG